MPRRALTILDTGKKMKVT